MPAVVFPESPLSASGDESRTLRSAPAAMNPEPLAGMGFDAGLQAAGQLGGHFQRCGVRNWGFEINGKAQAVGLTGGIERDQIGFVAQREFGG